jgi:bifunctional UDP-N-acetylglucosamine pyrophosphorylase / glucosamine-1-phosphate N-acetyltransferase
MHTICSTILAAGKGTRLKSSLPKVMHEILGYPLIYYSLALVSDISENVIAVVGHGRGQVTSYLRSFSVATVVQEPQLGTGHAILMAKKSLNATHAEHVLILPGDMPLIRKESLTGLLKAYHASGADMGILTARIADPSGYGRVVRDKTGKVMRIVEHGDATENQREIDEINTSVYVVNKEFLLKAVDRLSPDNAKGELYLTDVVPLAKRAISFSVTDPDEAHGINSRAQLAFAQKHMQQRINNDLMESGVTFMDPDTAWIGPEALLGQDVEIWPNVHILGRSTVAAKVRIMPNTWIKDGIIGASSTIGFGSIIEDRTVEKGSFLPPYTRLASDT